MQLKLPKFPDKDRVSKSYVRAFLDLSTGHYRLADDALLSRAEVEREINDVVLPIYTTKLEFGYIVHLCGEGGLDLGPDEYQALQTAGFSVAIIDLIRYASQRGFRGIWFDADADKSPCFPVFKWDTNDDGASTWEPVDIEPLALTRARKPKPKE